MMAVTAEGFSIREYAWRMRSVDVGKCWPFDAPDEEDEMKSMLPPITVKKFSWWFDELQFACSGNENLDQNPERDESFPRNEGDDIEESDNTIDEVRGRGTKKGKAPKKRSIVELFAVAPQVEMVDDEDDDEDIDNDNDKGSDSDNDREDGYSINPKLLGAKTVNLERKGKKKEMKVKANLKKQKKVIRKDKKKKKNREDGFMDFKIAKKERSYKTRVQSPVNFAAYLDGSLYKKGLRKDNLDAISTLRKKPQLKQSTTEKKRKDLRITKSFSKCKNPEVALRGILKNHTKVLPVQSSTSCTLQDASEENPCSTHQANKHVTFSLTDGMLGPIWKVPPAVRSDAVAFIKDSTEETRESSDIIITNGKRIICSTDVQPVTGEKLCVTSHAVAGHNFQKQPTSNQENFFDGCVTKNSDPLQGKNLHLLDGSFQVASHDPMHACSPGYAKSPEGYGHHPSVQVLGNSSSTSSIWGELGDLSGNHGHRLAQVCYKDFMKTHPQPSSSYLSNWNPNAMQGPLFPSKSISRNYSDLQQYPFLHFSPKQLMRTISSIPGWKQEDTMHGDISMDEHFVGLPLNSQGELIKLNSSGKRRFDQLTRQSTTTGPSVNLAVPTNISLCRSNYSDFSSWDGRPPSEEHLQFFPPKGLVNEKPYFVVPCGFGGDYQCIQRTNIGSAPVSGCDQSMYPVESDLDHMISPHHHWKLYDQALKHTDNVQIQHQGNPDHVSLHVTQSTMRLMGKEFTVGERDLQPFVDGDVWKDKQIITEHLPGNNAMDKSQAHSEYIVHSTAGKLREALASSSRINVNEDSESVLQMKIPESSRPLPHLICQSDVLDQDAFGSIRESPAAVRSLYNYDFFLQEPVNLGCRMSNISSQGPSFARDKLTKGVSSSYNNLPHATKSGFSFPFLHSFSEGHSHSSWPQSTSRSIYPSMSDAIQKGTFRDYFPSFPDLGSSYYADVQTSENFRSYNSFQPNSALQNPVGLGVPSQRPPVPLVPRSRLNLSRPIRHGDTFGLKDWTNSKGCARGPDPCKRTNKRRADLSTNFMKPRKIPTLAFQESYSCAKGALKDHADGGGDVQCQVKAIEFGAASETVNTNRGDKFDVNKNTFKDSSGLDSSELNNSTRAGPVKLTAGAKHILKPSQKAGQNNAMPMQSTIHFIETTIDDKVSQSEKSAKIYKF